MIHVEMIIPYYIFLFSAILIFDQVYIYFISNDVQDRTSETQLNLELPSIRSQYLNIWELNQDYVEHEVYRKGKWDRRWDYSKENGEILVRKEIPSRRVLGRCRYIDLEDCRMNWWLDKLTGASTQGNKTLRKYQEAMRLLKLEIGRSLLEKIAASAQKMNFVCLDRDDITSILTSETLFYIMIYGLTRKESEPQIALIRISGQEIWDLISSETEKTNRDGKMMTTPTQETDERMEEKVDALNELENDISENVTSPETDI